MKSLKAIAIGSMLLGLATTAFAEGGYERAKQFHENFRAEQTRLWNDGSSNQNKQQVAQEQQKERKDNQEQAKN